MNCMEGCMGLRKSRPLLFFKKVRDGIREFFLIQGVKIKIRRYTQGWVNSLLLFLFRSLVNKIHELVELGRNDDLCAAVALLAYCGCI